MINFLIVIEINLKIHILRLEVEILFELVRKKLKNHSLKFYLHKSANSL